jgi:hypothetical protein
VVYEGYVDDSKDRHAEKVVVSGIFIGHQEAWASLRAKWKKRLDKDGMRYFKASEYYGLRGEFQQFRSEADYPVPSGRNAARLIFDDLEVIINQTEIASMGVVIPVQDFNEVLADPRAKGRLPTNAYSLALNLCFYQTVQELNKVPGRHVVRFVHDCDDRFSIYKECYDRFKDANPKTAKQMCGFTALDDKEHPPLQAADLAANVTCNFAKDWLEQDRTVASLQRLKDSMLRICVGTKDFLLKLLDDTSKRSK